MSVGPMSESGFHDAGPVARDLTSLGLAPGARASGVLWRLLLAAIALFVLLLVCVPWQQSVDGTGRVLESGSLGS